MSSAGLWASANPPLSAIVGREENGAESSGPAVARPSRGMEGQISMPGIGWACRGSNGGPVGSWRGAQCNESETVITYDKKELAYRPLQHEI